MWSASSSTGRIRSVRSRCLPRRWACRSRISLCHASRGAGRVRVLRSAPALAAPPGGQRPLAAWLDRESINERVLVLNAAYDRASLRDAYAAGRDLGATHLVFTHLDEVPQWGKLWDYLFDEEVEPLFLGTGPSLTGDCEEDVPGAIVAAHLARRRNPEHLISDEIRFSPRRFRRFRLIAGGSQLLRRASGADRILFDAPSAACVARSSSAGSGPCSCAVFARSSCSARRQAATGRAAACGRPHPPARQVITLIRTPHEYRHRLPPCHGCHARRRLARVSGSHSGRRR
jgi:hypothetical protein